MRAVKLETATVPVCEVFGPTVQGEGPQAGRPAYFIRFGGCDFRCLWCDSMYAVDPEEVRRTATRMTLDGMRCALSALEAGPSLVVLTGGNPALHELGGLIDRLHADGFDVAVETQGSVYRPWLARVDQLVVSPKPPSSGEATVRNHSKLNGFMGSALREDARLALKVVVFDDGDLAYARRIATEWPDIPLYLSVGTDPETIDAEGHPTAEEDAVRILERFRWLCEAAAVMPDLADAKVLPQLHVLAWGRARGV